MKITMPLVLYLPRKTKKDKRVALSLSTYRNLHYMVSNQAKKIYKDIVKEKIIDWNLWNTIKYHILFYKNSKRRVDLDNWTCIQEKFMNDALVELWHIKEDNTDHIIEIKKTYWGLDRWNWRCEFIFYNIS